MEAILLREGRMKHIVRALIIVVLAASSASAALPYGNSSETTLSVFMVKDTQSDNSGFGAALSRLDQGMTDLSYMDIDKFTLAQLSKLSPKQLGPYNAYFGFAVAFATPDDMVIPDEPQGWYSGLELILGKVELSYGLSLELRASSLSHDFDPIAWLSDPDLFILGGGLSYKF